MGARPAKPFHLFPVRWSAQVVAATCVVGGRAIGDLEESIPGPFVTLALDNILGDLLPGLRRSMEPRSALSRRVRLRVSCGPVICFRPVATDCWVGICRFAATIMSGIKREERLGN